MIADGIIQQTLDGLVSTLETEELLGKIYDMPPANPKLPCAVISAAEPFIEEPEEAPFNAVELLFEIELLAEISADVNEIRKKLFVQIEKTMQLLDQETNAVFDSCGTITRYQLGEKNTLGAKISIKIPI